MPPLSNEDPTEALHPGRGDGGMATSRPRGAILSEDEAQRAFRRLCTSRATRRAIRDHRLFGKG